MKYVILRDDDTNALMPVECLERLYRPFLRRNLPVNLAVIPNVASDASYRPGQLEGFLMASPDRTASHVPIGCNPRLIRYLQDNPLYHVVQHGCSHESVDGHYEFDHDDIPEIRRRLDEGLDCLSQAGLEKPETFVAPYDQLSRSALREVAARFSVLSTGWYEWRRVPPSWWPRYFWKKLTGAPHWRAGGLALLSHPGCHLSFHRSYSLILQEIEKSIQSRRLTVLVTHWWEYFRDGKPDEAFIAVLHKTAEYLAGRPDLQVITFEDIARRRIALTAQHS